MTTKNETLVRQLFDEVLNRRNLAAVDKIVSDDSIDHGPSMIGTMGIEGFRQAIRLFHDALPDLQYIIDEIISIEDKVVICWTAQGTFTGPFRGIQPNGRSTSFTGVIIYRIADGKIQESWGNWDALGMMEQLDVISLAAVH